MTGRTETPPTFDATAPSRVSYVLATKDRAEYLDEALVRYRDLLTPQDELIVVDGGSSDATQEVVRRHEKVVTAFVSEPDVSEAHAVNKGILRATGRYVKQLTDDDHIRPAAMEQAIRILDDHAEIDILQCGGYREIDGHRTPVYVPPGSDYGRRVSDIYHHDVCGVGIVTRRAAYARIGLYNPRAKAPDGDFVAQAIAAGATVRFARIDLFDHPILPHSLTVGARAAGYHEDVLRIARDHFPRRDYVRIRLRRALATVPGARQVARLARSARAQETLPEPVWDAGLS